MCDVIYKIVYVEVLKPAQAFYQIKQIRLC